MKWPENPLDQDHQMNMLLPIGGKGKGDSMTKCEGGNQCEVI
jgi:hypothetical protein